jgi:hypothetical protein
LNCPNFETQTEFSEVKFMSDIQKQSQTNAAVASSVALPSRRKLIRLGAVAVPAVATLTSQSALATSCVSGSAWGSDQVSNSASQKARHDSRAEPVTTGFKISAWNAAASPVNSLTSPWAAFKTAYPNFTNFGPNNNRTFRQGEVTFRQLQTLDSAKFKVPAGFNLDDKVVSNLGNNNQSFFWVAQLNFASNLKPPTKCVTDADWGKIVGGTYPTAGSPWSLEQTALYLKNNFIVQA